MNMRAARMNPSFRHRQLRDWSASRVLEYCKFPYQIVAGSRQLRASLLCGGEKSRARVQVGAERSAKNPHDAVHGLCERSRQHSIAWKTQKEDAFCQPGGSCRQTN